MTKPYGELYYDEYSALNQGQIEALAIRYGMNDIFQGWLDQLSE